MEIEWRRAAVYVVCRDGAGRILLTRFSSPGHPDDGAWGMPGGGMEWGESPADTAHRELAEETGLAVTLGRIVDVYSRWFTEEDSALGRAGHLVGIVYEATEVRGELRTTFEPGTTDAVRWFALDEIPRLRRIPVVDAVLAALADP